MVAVGNQAEPTGRAFMVFLSSTSTYKCVLVRIKYVESVLYVCYLPSRCLGARVVPSLEKESNRDLPPYNTIRIILQTRILS